ncbi:MAG TPA: tetratricopeptide repeat protein [Longimicrobium sp.]|jgi:tetratricopeptide (TPR) repeat protein
MSLPLRVERALALVPDLEEFLPFSDALIGTSHPDGEKKWARSSAYTTLGKRVVDAGRLGEVIPRIAERVQERVTRLYTLVFTAIQQQEAGNPAAAAETLVKAGELEEEERRLEKAETFYTLALEIARDLRQKGPQILALRRLGRVNRAAGRLEEAWGWYQQSYNLSVDQMDLAGQIIACQGLGNLCDDHGERDQAQQWYERGLALAGAVDDPQLTWPFYTNLSILALMRGELAEADELLARARRCFEAIGDDSLMFYWYNNRGLLRLESGDLAEAEHTFREGLARGPDPFWEILIRENLGQALARQGRLFEAEQEARRAEELAILHRYVPRLVEVYLLFGDISCARRDEEGFVFYEQALEVCRERGLPRVKAAAVHRGYGLLLKACGRPAEAQAYLQQARETYAELGLAPELSRVEADLAGLGAAAAA